MKKTILLFSAAVAMSLSACNGSGNNDKTAVADSTHPLDTTKLAKGTAFYQCEMHPEVTSDKPGACSKCGMDLTKVEKK